MYKKQCNLLLVWTADAVFKLNVYIGYAAYQAA